MFVPALAALHCGIPAIVLTQVRRTAAYPPSSSRR